MNRSETQNIQLLPKELKKFSLLGGAFDQTILCPVKRWSIAVRYES